jgi:hypothetical protein
MITSEQLVLDACQCTEARRAPVRRRVHIGPTRNNEIPICLLLSVEIYFLSKYTNVHPAGKEMLLKFVDIYRQIVQGLYRLEDLVRGGNLYG